MHFFAHLGTGILGDNHPKAPVRGFEGHLSNTDRRWSIRIRQAN